MPDSALLLRPGDSIETRRSWIAAGLALALLAVSYGAPLPVVVGLKPIQATLGADRSVVALAGALIWIETKAEIAAHQGASTRSNSATMTESATASVVRAQCPPRAPVISGSNRNAGFSWWSEW